MKKKWFIYIVQCSDKSLYTGCTNNLNQRIARHNEGRGAKYTKYRTPVTLRYSEACSTHSVALKREAQIKNWTRKKKQFLIELRRRSSVS